MEYNLDDNRPILVQFENGVLKEAAKNNIVFKHLRSKVAKSNKRMLVADSGALTYTGVLTQKQPSFVKYYVGIVDKRTNTIEQIEQCQIVTLKPKLQDEQTVKDEKSKVKTFKQKSDTLVEAFGSSKQRRLLSSRKKNESVHETISDKVADVAKQILAESPISLKAASSPLPEDETFVLPPMNKEAKKVNDIFHIDDIISFQDYQFLKGYAQDFVNCNNETIQTWKAEQKYPEYILHHLSQLPISSTEREEKCCYLCYLDYLIKVFKLTYKDIRKKDPCPDIPAAIKNNILNTFTQSIDGRNRTVPKKHKDKLLCYILVLSLIIDEFELSCNLLMKDLKLGVARLTKLLRAIGCSVKTTSTRKRKSDEDVLPRDSIPTVMAVLTTSSVLLSNDVKSSKIQTVKEEKPAEIKQEKTINIKSEQQTF